MYKLHHARARSYLASILVRGLKSVVDSLKNCWELVASLSILYIETKRGKMNGARSELKKAHFELEWDSTDSQWFLNYQLSTSGQWCQFRDATYSRARVRLLACGCITFALYRVAISWNWYHTVLQDLWDLSHDGTLCACVNYVIDYMSDVGIHVFKFNIRNFWGHV